MSSSPSDIARSLQQVIATRLASIRAATVASTGSLHELLTIGHASIDRVVFGLAVGVIMITGYLQGTIEIILALPTALGGASIALPQAAVACVTLTTIFGLSGTALLAKLRNSRIPSLPTRGPTVTAIIPVYDDGAVLDRSVKSLLASRYCDLQVVIVTEPNDDDSIAQARSLADDHERARMLINTETPGSKAGAINHAVAATDSNYIAVFDADEQVHEAFIASAVARLNGGSDIVQGRTIPDPDGLIETVAYYESVVLGDLSRRLTTLLTDFTMAASRTVVMRRDAFTTVDGYDREMLTEDYDFAFACYNAGLDVTEQFAHASVIEAAHSLTDWWGQRKRWMTGYAQVLHRLLGECRSPTGYRSIVAPAICAASVLGNLFMLSLVPKAAALFIQEIPGWLWLPIGTLAMTAAAIRLHDVVAGRLDSLGVGYLLLPVILPVYSLAGIKAVVEYLLTWDGEWYSVSKK